MSYIFRHKADLIRLSPRLPQERTILILEPGEELSGLYRLHLEQCGYLAHPCFSIPHLDVGLGRAVPNLAIISGDLPEGPVVVAKVVADTVKKVPGLPIVTVSHNATPEDIKLYMQAGVCSHVNRKFGRLRDIVEVVNTLLNNN